MVSRTWRPSPRRWPPRAAGAEQQLVAQLSGHCYMGGSTVVQGVDGRRQLPELHAGVYRHWKGQLYQVFGYAHDANDDERVVVVYMGLQLIGARRGARMAVRSVEDFFAWVNPASGEVLEAGDGLLPEGADIREGWRPRFRYCAPSFDQTC
jgi:hypothetical protein